MKHLGSLRFMPQFSERFNFVSERKNSSSVLFKIRLYIMPRAYLRSFTIFVQERYRGCFNLARDGASREHQESPVEQGGAQRVYCVGVKTTLPHMADGLIFSAASGLTDCLGNWTHMQVVGRTCLKYMWVASIFDQQQQARTDNHLFSLYRVYV